MSEATRVAVVGGGITGLAAAHRLFQCFVEDFVLIEGSPRLGGKILTEKVDGAVIEGGPDGFLSAKQAGVGMCEKLGIQDRLIGADAKQRRTFVKREGRLHQLPEGFTGLVPSRLWPLVTTKILSPIGRARAGLEMFVRRKRATCDESIADFVTRRFGAEAYRWLVEPLLSGIYAGNGEHLSLQSTFPRLAEMERNHGSILRSMVRVRNRSRPGATAAAPGFVTLRGGLEELVAALEARLPAEQVKRGIDVTSVRRGATQYHLELRDGSTLSAEAVILATPAFVSARLVRKLDPEFSSVMDSIPFVSTATVSVAYAASAVPEKLNGYGYVSPRAEGGPIVACTWTSNKFPDRVRQGDVLVRFFIGREGSEDVAEWTDERLLDMARSELARLFGVRQPPSIQRVFRWPQAMPQYTLGHADRLTRMERMLGRHPGLHLAGSSYRGVGIPDCIASGWTAAEAVVSELRQGGPLTTGGRTVGRQSGQLNRRGKTVRDGS